LYFTLYGVHMYTLRKFTIEGTMSENIKILIVDDEEDIRDNNTLIVFLTARGESFTQISALETGGDDFISKPVKPNVLKSRIKAMLRRHPSLAANQSDNISTYGDLTIDREKFGLTVGEKEISLAKKEFYHACMDGTDGYFVFYLVFF